MASEPPSSSERSVERLAYLAAVVDASSDAILSKSLDGTITSWNASAERIFGFTAGEMVGQNIRRLIPSELQSEEDEILAKLRAGQFIDHFETVRLTKSGSRLEVSLSISPIMNSNGEVVGAAKIARDVTARKEADALLVATTAKFESVFNQSGIFAGILDLDGRVLQVNDLAVEQCGYARESVLDRPFWETAWWRGSAEVQGQIHDAVREAASGGIFRKELPYWLADGSERVVDFAMHPIRGGDAIIHFLHPTGIDITDRTRAEEALRAREAEEREIAVGLQRALLPDRLTMPMGISCSARYEAGSEALEVGGDWYDAFVLADGRVAVTVGDVVGHGLAAAAAMGQLRTALAALSEEAASPGELLTRLDSFLGRTGTTDFATVCYGVLDPNNGVFEYASAGHPPILLVDPSGRTKWLDDANSPPLYGQQGRSRVQASTVLPVGSLLILYSDGLIERRGAPLADGLGRLADAARHLFEASTAEACDSLVDALGADASRTDDVAVLAVRLDAAPIARFRRVFPARPEELRDLRGEMRLWMQEREVDESRRNALMLAVGEACSNSVEHAYAGRDLGDVTVEILEHLDRSLSVLVRDFGGFTATEGAPDRGRGTTIMRALTSEFYRASTTNGTAVRFRLPVKETGPA
jgi:PAS domain S-box-containing protein